MAEPNNGLPEGTDTIIEGGGAGGSSGGTGSSGTGSGGFSPSITSNSTGGRTTMTASDSGTDSLITQGNDTASGGSSGGSAGNSNGGSGTGSDSGGIRGMLATATTKAKDEAGTRARGLVSQGLTSSSAALGNVASIIEDTVEQIGERLGPQYADYARTASQTVNRYASTLQNKDPDELVDDARELVRKSPGVALAGAAIIGFGLVRLLKAGIDGSDTTGTGSGSRNNRHSD